MSVLVFLVVFLLVALSWVYATVLVFPIVLGLTAATVALMYVGHKLEQVRHEIYVFKMVYVKDYMERVSSKDLEVEEGGKEGN